MLLFLFFPLHCHCHCLPRLGFFVAVFFFLVIWEGMCNNAAMWLPVISVAVTEYWTEDCGKCPSVPLEKLRLLFQLLAHFCTVAVLGIISRVLNGPVLLYCRC